MKLLVIGGTHGNELLGIELVELLKKDPISGVDVCIANPKAVAQGKRFIETDLNRSFGASAPLSYEETRAQEITQLCSMYDVVLDFHNTQTPGNNTCFAGEARSNILESVAASLGFSNGIIATYDCINKYCKNTLSIEISMEDELDDAWYWYEQIRLLACNTNKRSENLKKIQWYDFLRRVSWQEQQELNLNGWVPFVSLSTRDRQLLSITEPEVAPIFIGSTLTKYYATLVSKQSMLAKQGEICENDTNEFTLDQPL